MKYKAAPPKIREMISYLSYSFSNPFMECRDNEQDLWILYTELLSDTRNDGKKDGWFFMKFKWNLLNKYKKETTRINNEWDVIKELYLRGDKRLRMYKVFLEHSIRRYGTKRHSTLIKRKQPELIW